MSGLKIAPFETSIYGESCTHGIWMYLLPKCSTGYVDVEVDNDGTTKYYDRYPCSKDNKQYIILDIEGSDVQSDDEALRYASIVTLLSSKTFLFLKEKLYKHDVVHIKHIQTFIEKINRENIQFDINDINLGAIIREPFESKIWGNNVEGLVNHELSSYDLSFTKFNSVLKVTNINKKKDYDKSIENIIKYLSRNKKISRLNLRADTLRILLTNLIQQINTNTDITSICVSCIYENIVEWLAYDEFGECSKECDGGIKTRNRKCNTGNIDHCKKYCNGQEFETKSCNIHKCSAMADLRMFMGKGDQLFTIIQELNGFDVNGWNEAANNFVSRIRKSADQINKFAKDFAIAQTTGGSVGIVSGLMCIAGIFAAPFSGGTSLALTVGGIVGGVASTITIITSSEIQKHWKQSETEAIETSFKRYDIYNKILQKLMDRYSTAMERLGKDKEFQIALVGFVETVQLSEFKHYSKVVLSGALTASAISKAKTAISLLKAMQRVSVMKEWSNLFVAIASVEVIAPRNMFLGLVKTGHRISKIINVLGGVLGVTFGIVDVVVGSDILVNGDETANMLLEQANEISKKHDENLETFLQMKENWKG
eukprot:476035_1